MSVSAQLARFAEARPTALVRVSTGQGRLWLLIRAAHSLELRERLVGAITVGDVQCLQAMTAFQLDVCQAPVLVQPSSLLQRMVSVVLVQIRVHQDYTGLIALASIAKRLEK